VGNGVDTGLLSSGKNLQRNALLVKDLQELHPVREKCKRKALANLIDKEPLLTLTYLQKPNPDKQESRNYEFKEFRS
jgi:hypothetical protein